MKLINAFALASVFSVVAACSSGPTVRGNADPGADLKSYKTFGFFQQVSTDQSQYTTLISKRLKDATKRELEKRGYTFSETDPQLLANFHVNIENRQDVVSTPTMSGGYYGYRRGMYGAWGGYAQDVDTVHYQVGTLTIDVVDAAKKQLVWQGTAEGRVGKQLRENPGDTLDLVVTEVFTQYPVPPSTPAPTK